VLAVNVILLLAHVCHSHSLESLNIGVTSLQQLRLQHNQHIVDSKNDVV